MLAEKRPDIKIVGDELHPLQKVNDFSPYVAKIKASGADTVITGNWSNDMVLLIKAGKDAGLKVAGTPTTAAARARSTAIGEAGVDTLKQVSEWHRNAVPELDASVAAFTKRYPGKENEFAYWRAKTMWEMFAAAAKKAGSNDPVKVAKALEGMKMSTSLGEVEMRADNHQILQPLSSRRCRRASSTTARRPGSAGRPTPRSTPRRRRCRRPARWSGRSSWRAPHADALSAARGERRIDARARHRSRC